MSLFGLVKGKVAQACGRGKKPNNKEGNTTAGEDASRYGFIVCQHSHPFPESFSSVAHFPPPQCNWCSGRIVPPSPRYHWFVFIF